MKLKKLEIEYKKDTCTKVVVSDTWNDEDLKKLIKEFQRHFEVDKEGEWEAIGSYKDGFDEVKFVYNHKYKILGIIRKYGDFYKIVSGAKSLANRKEVEYLIQTSLENARKLFRRKTAKAVVIYYPLGTSEDIQSLKIEAFMKQLR
jgi:mRNA degradation ribonuclease J1/J2